MVQCSSGWSLTWARSMLPMPRCSHPSHCDSISTKLVQAGEYQNQVGAGDDTVMVLDDQPAQHTNIKDSKQISEPKLVLIEGSFIISYLLCFMAISKSRNLRSDGVVGRMKMEPSRWIGWSHHITSISHSQKRVRGCEGREQHSSHFTHLMIDSSLIACSLSVSFSHLK